MKHSQPKALMICMFAWSRHSRQSICELPTNNDHPGCIWDRNSRHRFKQTQLVAFTVACVYNVYVKTNKCEVVTTYSCQHDENREMKQRNHKTISFPLQT